MYVYIATLIVVDGWDEINNEIIAVRESLTGMEAFCREHAKLNGDPLLGKMIILDSVNPIGRTAILKIEGVDNNRRDAITYYIECWEVR